MGIIIIVVDVPVVVITAIIILVYMICFDINRARDNPVTYF